MSARERPTTVEGPVLGRGPTMLLLATVFASGTAVMIVEMTAVRALQPFFGSTTYVWTHVIAVVLAALAVGYAVGGRLADRRPSPAILYGLLAAGGLLLVGCALLVTPISRLFLKEGLGLEGIVTVLSRGSLGATLVLFAPPILLLGMISPMAIRLLSRGGVGRAAGHVFAISTVGSILGTYLPTFVLVPRVGSRGSILVSATILLVAGAVGLVVFLRRLRVAGPVALVLLCVAARGSLAAAWGDVRPDRGAPPLRNGAVARVLREVESPYQYLTVREDTYPDGRVEQNLTINEGIYTYHSFRVEGRVMTDSRYYDAYSLVPFLLDLEPGAELRACVVGMACGINASQWKHFWSPIYRLRVEGAELDPAIVALGREFFGLPEPGADWLAVHEMDGRQMLEAVPDRRYHMIVVDAFANELYIPFHLATEEFFRLCFDRLEPGGILAMNVYAVGQDAPNLAAIENTLATVFGRCLRFAQYYSSNFLLMARRGADTPDLRRLSRRNIRHRFRDWDGFDAWSRIPEWDHLTNLSNWYWEREQGSIEGYPPAAVVKPQVSERVLTDDRAPLEWLTDRFLAQTEAARLDEQDGAELRALLERQGRLLLGIQIGWAAALIIGLVCLRRRGLI